MRKEGRTEPNPTQGEEFQLHLLLRVALNRIAPVGAAAGGGARIRGIGIARIANCESNWKQIPTQRNAMQRQTQTQTSRQTRMH